MHMTKPTPPLSPEPIAAGAPARALWVVALYALFASLWILLSDHLVALWIADPETAAVVATLKGWIFVGVTSVLLYVLVRRGMSQSSPVAVTAEGATSASWPTAHRRRRWLLYLLAITTTLATLFLRTQIAVAFGERPLLILMMFPILLSATVGGLGPGLTATLLAAVGIDYTAIPPVGSLRIAATHDLLQLGFLILNGVLVSVLSEQMHRSRQRVEANLRLQSVTLAGIADGVIATDAHGRIGFFNPAAARLTGWDDAQALGRPLAEVVPLLDPDRREPVPWPLPPHEDSGRQEALLLGREGEIPVRVRCSPIASALDGALGQVLVLHDIREEQAVARTEELRQARAEAERLARAKGDFLANMSHEIRTPLNAVLGFARIGLRDSTGRAVANEFSRILASGEHLLGVINDVLDYSKIEAGKLGIEAMPFQLATVVAKAGAFVSGIGAQKGIGYSAVLAPDLPDWVLGDAQRVQQVLTNLLSNAVKFTPSGEVRLEIARDGDDIRLRVSDTGIGMNEEQLARLFTPFEQADGSTTRRFGGSGLGLAISRQLVQLMGGEIGVESAPGRGSTFNLRLPLPATEPPEEPVRLDAIEAPGGRRLARVRVLAAEDVEVNRLVLGDLLLQEGAEVHFAKNGREALELVEHLGPQSFDIVLMDVQMPEMDGYAATRALRQRAPQLPVIGLTAHALAEERARCLEAGMVDHVAKPIDPEQLVAAIRRHLVQTAPSVPPAAATPGPAPGPDPGVSGIVDWPGLMQRFGGRRAFVQRLSNIAIKSEADTPVRLRQVAEAGDAQTLAFMAHALKGTAGNLMAQSVYALALATEQAARGESPEAFGQARNLAEATERLLAELAEWSGRIDSPS
jgi:PAS domain S-box-containing protein